MSANSLYGATITTLRAACIALGMVLLGSGPTAAQQKVEQWGRFETTLLHPTARNGFSDVELTATFAGPETTYAVSGFYDGMGIFKIRFMPPSVGRWQ